LYNLLVSASGWAETRDSLLASRAFEYTDDHIVERFMSDGKLDFSALTNLPTLFLEESSAGGILEATCCWSMFLTWIFRR